MDTSFVSTKGIDPALDPNTLSIEDPRNPLVARRREADAKKAAAAARRTRDDL